MNIKKCPMNEKGRIMGKTILALAVIFVVTFFSLDVAAVSAKTTSIVKKPAVAKSIAKKKPVKSKNSQAKTTLQWTASGLKALGSMAAFDYSYTIRNVIIKKVENYARRKKIKIITAAVVKSMDE